MYLVVLLNLCVCVCVHSLALCMAPPLCAICVGACVCVGLCPGPSAQQKMMPMDQHGPYRPPSEERLSPGQQSPLMKGSQRVVTLAQHISVSPLVNDMVFILILKNYYILLYYQCRIYHDKDDFNTVLLRSKSSVEIKWGAFLGG